MKKQKTLEDWLYVISWIALVIGGIGAGFYLKLVSLPDAPSFPCVMWSALGLYCPGCGGTRAVIALLRGRILQSLWYHPLVLYMVVLYGGFLLTQSLERLQVRGVKGWKFHTWPLYGAVVVLFLNMIIKNVLLLCFHITL